MMEPCCETPAILAKSSIRAGSSLLTRKAFEFGLFIVGYRQMRLGLR